MRTISAEKHKFSNLVDYSRPEDTSRYKFSVYYCKGYRKDGNKCVSLCGSSGYCYPHRNQKPK